MHLVRLLGASCFVLFLVACGSGASATDGVTPFDAAFGDEAGKPDRVRLHDHVQVFAAHARACELDMYEAGVIHTYPMSSIYFSDVSADLFTLSFTLGGGSAGTDSYSFDVDLGVGGVVKIETTANETKYTYDETLGYTDSLTLTESTSGSHLFTHDASSHVQMSCDD